MLTRGIPEPSPIRGQFFPIRTAITLASHFQGVQPATQNKRVQLGYVWDGPTKFPFNRLFCH